LRRAFDAGLGRWKAVTLVALGIALTSCGHYLTPREYLLWHGIFQRLYYLPVVFAAIAFGWVGGLAAGLASAALYVPHIVTTWAHDHHYTIEQYAEIFMFLAVGIVTGILSDRERRRRAELQSTADELNRVNRELQSSFEQVRRADRLSAIGQLAAGLAHEIRNPLASIDGAAEVLAESAEQEDLRRETVGIIRKECARLNRLLGSLLDFARPRAPEMSNVDVSKVVGSVMELVTHSAGRGIRFRTDLPDRLPRLCCDEEQLAQVLLNLTINAAQAMPDGGEICLSARLQDGGVLLEVRDQGIGVPDQDLDRILDPFFTTKPGGTGLGLSVVHQIITQHGGTLSFRHNPDRGMTVSVLFPVPDGVSA
jgi:two-component system, NtrC family, sensor histidine kinase HydH